MQKRQKIKEWIEDNSDKCVTIIKLKTRKEVEDRVKRIKASFIKP